MASDPPQVTPVNISHQSRSQSPAASITDPSQSAWSKQPTLGRLYQNEYPHSHPVPAKFYDCPFVVYTNQTHDTDDCIEQEPLESLYDKDNQILAYMKSDGNMGMKTMRGTQRFTGSTSGQMSEVHVGETKILIWQEGMEDTNAERCSGKWGVVVPQDGSAVEYYESCMAQQG